MGSKKNRYLNLAMDIIDNVGTDKVDTIISEFEADNYGDIKAVRGDIDQLKKQAEPSKAEKIKQIMDIQDFDEKSKQIKENMELFK